MHYSSLGLLFIGLSIFTHNALAGGSGRAITGKIGTLGAGVEYTHSLSGTIDGRIGLYSGKLDGDYEQDDIEYTGDLSLKNIAVFADYHPSMGGFRMTAGAIKENSQVNLNADSPTLEFNDKTYNASLIGTVKRDGLSPYLGIGWDSATRKRSGWSLSLDVGVIYQDELDVSLTGSCNGDANTCNEFNADVAQEEAEIKADAEDLKLYPVIAIGLSRSF